MWKYSYHYGWLAVLTVSIVLLLFAFALLSLSFPFYADTPHESNDSASSVASGATPCGTSTSITNVAVNADSNLRFDEARSAESQFQQRFASDPGLSCIGKVMLSSCRSTFLLLDHGGGSADQFATYISPDKHTCVVKYVRQESVSGQSDLVEDSISCSLPELEDYLRSGSVFYREEDIQSFDLFDHNQPGAYAGDVARALMKMDSEWFIGGHGCTVFPPRQQI